MIVMEKSLKAKKTELNFFLNYIKNILSDIPIMKEKNFKILVTYTQSNSFGESKKIELPEYIEILKKYSLFFWLDIIAKIENRLLSNNNLFNREVHIDIARVLFSETALNKTVGRDKIGNGVFFFLPQLNLIRKIALVYCLESEEIPRSLSNLDKTNISKIFLCANDYTHSASRDKITINDRDGFFAYMNKNMIAVSPEDINFRLIRAYKMYVSPTERTEFHSKLEALSIQKTGYSLKELMTLFFTTYIGLFQNSNIGELAGRTSIINADVFYANLKQDKKAIFERITISKKELLIKIGEIKEDNLERLAYDMKVFSSHPFCKLDDGRFAFCSVNSLVELISIGLPWNISNLIIDDNEKGSVIQQLTEYRGKIFESYVRDLFVIMEKTGTIKILKNIDNSNKRREKEISDLVITDKKRISVLEIKSTQTSSEYKITGMTEHAKSFFNKLVQASKQIYDSYEMMENNKIFTNENIVNKQVIPIIITFERLAINKFTNEYLEKIVGHKNLLTSDLFSNLNFLNITSIETIVYNFEKPNIFDFFSADKDEDDFLHDVISAEIFRLTKIGKVYNRRYNEVYDETWDFLLNECKQLFIV
jgi:hypothetical protein